MKRILLLTLILLAASARPASGEGLNLAWTDCAASSRSAANMTFGCGDEASTFTIVGSFIPPGGISALSGEEMELWIVGDKSTLPDWWRLGAGDCRDGGLGFSIQFPGLSGCTNYWGSQAAGGFDYASDVGSGRGKLRMIAAKPPSALGPVSSGREYYSFQVTLSSDGTGRCGGCAEGLCVIFNSLLLTQPVGYGDYVVSTPARSNFVSWQGGASSCPAAGGRQAERRSWGQVKGMYRAK